MSTDTSENGLELLIMRSLTGLSNEQILSFGQSDGVAESPTGYAGAGYLLGHTKDHAVDLRLQ